MCLKNLKRTAFKCILILPIVYFTLFLAVALFVYINRFNIDSEQFLELQKCPLCYGNDRWCANLMAQANDWQIDYEWNVLKLTSAWQSLINIKNVYFVSHLSNANTKMVLKKLAHTEELAQFDRDQRDCHSSINCLFKHKHFLNKKLTHKELRILNNDLNIELLSCFSDRFVDLIYATNGGNDQNLMDFNLNLLTKLKINPEPLILQVR